MLRITQFGTYVFPNTIPGKGQIYRDNLTNGVPRVERLPGMDGGFDQYGSDAFPTEVGNIRYRFVLIAETPAEMTDKIDAVNGLARLGRATLLGETHDGQERYTYAKVNSISMPIDADVYSDKRVEVTIDWQISFPRWFSVNDSSPQTEACSGTATTFTVNNAGNAPASPVISIDPTTAISASGLTIQRIVDSVVIDQIEYAAALLSTDVLEVDCKTLTVEKNSTDAYSTVFEAAGPAWLRLLPGDNSIKVILGGGETANVTFTYADTWY